MFLLYSDTYMPLLALLLYITIWRHAGVLDRVVFIYCVVNFILYGLTNVLADRGIHNSFLYHISSLVDLWLISYYILKKITQKSFSVLFVVIAVSYTVFFSFNGMFWEKWTEFNSNSAVVSSLIILFLCMYYLVTLSKSDDILYFQKLPSFWYVSGFLVYSAVSVLVLMSYRYFINANMINEGNSLWYVLDGGIIVKFALISTGLLCHKKRQTTHLPFLL